MAIKQLGGKNFKVVCMGQIVRSSFVVDGRGGELVFERQNNNRMDIDSALWFVA